MLGRCQSILIFLRKNLVLKKIKLSWSDYDE
jgi:hypothetical protein